MEPFDDTVIVSAEKIRTPGCKMGGRPYCRQHHCTCNDDLHDVFSPTTPHDNTALELGALCYHAVEDTNNRFNDVFWT